MSSPLRKDPVFKQENYASHVVRDENGVALGTLKRTEPMNSDQIDRAVQESVRNYFDAKGNK